MISNDRADAVSVNKLWYDNVYPNSVKTVQTYLDRTDKRRFTVDMRERYDNTNIVLTAESLSKALSKMCDQHMCVVNPTVFDKSHLSEWDYELALHSYYCSVVNEFDYDTVEYRYDTNLTVHSDSFVCKSGIDVLSYRAYASGNPNIGDTLMRVSRAYLIPAKYDTDTLILLEWDVSTAGSVIRRIVEEYRNVLRQNNGLYKNVVFVFRNKNTFQLYRDMFKEAAVLW